MLWSATRLESAASWALAFAYIISVTYYLNLFGAFAVTMTDKNDYDIACPLCWAPPLPLTSEEDDNGAGLNDR